MHISLPWVVHLYNNVSIGKKTCVETKLYMFNNPKSNREILVTKLKWKGFSFYKLVWELGPCHLSDFPFARHSICPTFVWILNCRTKTIHMLHVPYLRQQWSSTSQFPYSKDFFSDIPHVRRYIYSLGFQVF